LVEILEEPSEETELRIKLSSDSNWNDIDKEYYSTYPEVNDPVLLVNIF
jgi:hypothetical protein